MWWHFLIFLSVGLRKKLPGLRNPFNLIYLFTYPPIVKSSKNFDLSEISFCPAEINAFDIPHKLTEISCERHKSE